MKSATLDHWRKTLAEAGVPPLASKDDAARFLGTTRRTIERKIAARQLEAMKLDARRGGAVRISRDALARYLAGCEE